jgi:hypothetical protein
MSILVFNPEHDIALASNLCNFTAPHAGRQLRHDLGFLPALWAQEGDKVLVDDVETARRGYQKLVGRYVYLPDTSLFISADELTRSAETTVEPWGWDRAIVSFLRRKGVTSSLPTDIQLAEIRSLSHRRFAAKLLNQLTADDSLSLLPGESIESRLTGQSFECKSVDEINRCLQRWPLTVLKAPWSSSGRGVRFVTNLDAQKGWATNLLAQQGSVMAEPYYNKVRDFGAEFYSDGKGKVDFLGLSLFHTKNGAYTGNLLATESHKWSVITRYIPADLMQNVVSKIAALTGSLFRDKYKGPFGIDMMIVGKTGDVPALADESSSGFLLHPCVEMNLRRTMGHVSLALSRLINPGGDDELVRVMRIETEDNTYKLKIQRQ